MAVHVLHRNSLGLGRRPDGNVQHIAEHGLEIEDVVYQEIDGDTIRVVTAYEVPEGHG